MKHRSNTQTAVISRVSHLLTPLFLLVLTLSSHNTWASELGDPQNVVQDLTERLVDTVKQYQGEHETGSDALYSAVESALTPVVDFQAIARAVMGKHYQSSTQDQRNRFLKTFKRNLVTTYSKGFSGLGGLHIETQPAKNGKNPNRASIKQKVKTAEETLSITYTMVRKNQGEWRLLNVILGGVNLGRIYRNQFLQAVKRNQGDIEKTISSWAVQS